jgi:hypothetical protein
MHIPKTGGTSLRSLLRDHVYGKRLSEIYEDYGWWNSGPLRSHIGGADVLYGHFCHGFHDLVADPEPRYVTVLRHPVERVVSLYWHHRLIADAPWHERIKREKLALADFVEAQLSEETNNHMVRMLAAHYGLVRRWRVLAGNRLNGFVTGRPVRRLWTNVALKRALANVKKHFVFVGRLEAIGDLIDFVAEEAHVDGRTLTLPRENTRQAERVVVGQADRRIIENANELDLELYSRLFA